MKERYIDRKQVRKVEGRKERKTETKKKCLPQISRIFMFQSFNLRFVGRRGHTDIGRKEGRLEPKLKVKKKVLMKVLNSGDVSQCVCHILALSSKSNICGLSSYLLEQKCINYEDTF